MRIVKFLNLPTVQLGKHPNFMKYFKTYYIKVGIMETSHITLQSHKNTILPYNGDAIFMTIFQAISYAGQTRISAFQYT